MALLTDKKQTLVRAIGGTGMPTHRTGLTGVMSIKLDGHTPLLVGQLGGSQGLELLRRRVQFEFGHKRLFHRKNVLNFKKVVKGQPLMKYPHPSCPEQGMRHSSPRINTEAS